MNIIDKAFVDRVEASNLRTEDDTGANEQALMIWNQVRVHVGLERLSRGDLPAYCVTHGKYHKLRSDYGCMRKLS